MDYMSSCFYKQIGDGRIIGYRTYKVKYNLEKQENSVGQNHKKYKTYFSPYKISLNKLYEFIKGFPLGGSHDAFSLK